MMDETQCLQKSMPQILYIVSCSEIFEVVGDRSWHSLWYKDVETLFETFLWSDFIRLVAS